MSLFEQMGYVKIERKRGSVTNTTKGGKSVISIRNSGKKNERKTIAIALTREVLADAGWPTETSPRFNIGFTKNACLIEFDLQGIYCLSKSGKNIFRYTTQFYWTDEMCHEPKAGASAVITPKQIGAAKIKLLEITIPAEIFQ